MFEIFDASRVVPVVISGLVAVWILGQAHCQSARELRCVTPNSTRGSCVVITDCPRLQGALQDFNRPPEVTEYLRQLTCGSEGNLPKVCCELDDQTQSNDVDVDTDQRATPCRAPNGLRGSCLNVYSCASTLELLRRPRPLDPAIVAYLRRSRCDVGFSGVEFRVCCPGQSRPVRPGGTRPTTSRPMSVPTPAPTIGSPVINNNRELPRTCGKQGLIDRVVGGNETNIDEYPWMALIIYETEQGTRETSCGGSLISPRYILTAAHCVRGEIITAVGLPVAVRLGEYDKSKDRDCVPSTSGVDCADDPIEVNVESTIAHPGYIATSRTSPNDIALVRLATPVAFTDFIRPICLPSLDPTTQSAVQFVVAGWGQTDPNIPGSSNVKLHLQIPYFPHDSCSAVYARNFLLNRRTQLCAGGIEGKDSCRGDSGGPLMLLDSATNTWTLEGIVSFGPRVCAQNGVPGIYTKVIAFVPWVTQNVVP